MTVALVQQAKASNAFVATLGAGATAGNLLIAAFSRNDNASTPVVTTTGWARVGTTFVQAHPSFGGRAALWYKFATGGETTVTWSPQQGAITFAELSSTDGWDTGAGALAAGLANISGQTGTGISLASGNPGRSGLIIGVVVTRLRNIGDATITPGGGINRIPTANPLAATTGTPANGIHEILWAPTTGGAVTLSATQSGTTQDGFCWGMQIGAFGVRASARSWGYVLG